MHLNPTSALKPRHAIQVLLETFVCQQRYVPSSAHALASPKDLPPRLQFLARTRGPLSTWRAWTEKGRFWFIAGRLCNPHRTPAGLLALEIVFFDPDGGSVAAGEWILRPDGRWALRRVIDTSDRARSASVVVPRRAH